MNVAACLVLIVAVVAGCDDMSVQHKQNDYRNAAVGPGPVAAGTVAFAERPSAPPPLTLALIERGQNRFRAFCTPCHGELGDGRGMVVQRGFSPPPSYMIERLRAAPTQHVYDVITHGYGAMYSFAQRVPPADRWAIAAYVRALQRAAERPVADLNPAQQAMLR